MEEVGFRELPVTAVHAAAVRGLLDIHRASFDRLLVAQAMTEPLRLLSDDDNVAKDMGLVIKIGAGESQLGGRLIIVKTGQTGRSSRPRSCKRRPCRSHGRPVPLALCLLRVGVSRVVGVHHLLDLASKRPAAEGPIEKLAERLKLFFLIRRHSFGV